MRFVGIKYRAYFYVIVARVFFTQVIPSFQILSLNMAISAPLYCALECFAFSSLSCHVFGKIVFLVIFASKMHFFHQSVFKTVNCQTSSP